MSSRPGLGQNQAGGATPRQPAQAIDSATLTRRRVLDTKAILDALRQRWWMAAALILLGITAGALPSPQSKAQAITTWSAAHTLLLSSTSSTQTIYSDPVAFNQLELFAVTGEVPKRAAAALNFNGEPAALAAQVAVKTDQQTGAIRISTNQSSAAYAVKVADAFADQLTSYLAERQDSLKAQRLQVTVGKVDSLSKRLADIETQLGKKPGDSVLTAQLAALTREYSVVYEQNQQLLEEDGQLQLTTLERAQAIAVTSSGGLAAPSSRVSRGILGGVVGAIAGMGVTLLLARSDRRIRTRDQIEVIFESQDQVAVPYTSESHHGIVVTPDRHDTLSDSYRALRSVVSFVEAGKAASEGRVPVILVVSPSSGDAKTSVTSNLAAAFAETGVPSAVVNTDFRRPSLSKLILGRKPEPFAFTAEELATVSPALLFRPTTVEGMVLFDLAGSPGSPGELARMTAARIPDLNQSSVPVSVIVVDTSPVGATAEVLELVPLADVIVILVRVDHTELEPARNTYHTIKRLAHAQILSVVVGEKPGRKYYYEYAERQKSGKGRWRSHKV